MGCEKGTEKTNLGKKKNLLGERICSVYCMLLTIKGWEELFLVFFAESGKETPAFWQVLLSEQIVGTCVKRVIPF